MKQAAPLVIATLVAIAMALLPAFMPPQFLRPPRDEALDIIQAAADYNLMIQNTGAGGQLALPMAETVKPSHIEFIETKPCGAVEASEDCVVLDGQLGEETGRLLEQSWHDADVNLESYADITPENPLPKTIDIRRLQSSSAGEIARLQMAASRQKLDVIPASGLAVADVRKRISLRSDMPPHHLWIFSAPWVAGDIAFVEVGFVCGGECGRGENYALRKAHGKWRVLAVQPSWVS
ncbi:hypothetical protein [Sphingopyxis sp.]|uniref:hypothetical protein n=1 Tax=Sphingopyxis sp. TaxID=1908224 RepID=UPI0035ADD3DC